MKTCVKQISFPVPDKPERGAVDEEMNTRQGLPVTTTRDE